MIIISIEQSFLIGFWLSGSLVCLNTYWVKRSETWHSPKPKGHRLILPATHTDQTCPVVVAIKKKHSTAHLSIWVRLKYLIKNTDKMCFAIVKIGIKLFKHFNHTVVLEFTDESNSGFNKNMVRGFDSEINYLLFCNFRFSQYKLMGKVILVWFGHSFKLAVEFLLTSSGKVFTLVKILQQLINDWMLHLFFDTIDNHVF